MDITDIVVEVRRKDRSRVGVIVSADLSLLITGAFNQVGTWKLALASNHELADELVTPGAGIVVTGPTGTLMSGWATSSVWQASKASPDGDYLIEGVSDDIILGDRLTWPEPLNPDGAHQTLAHDVRTGTVEDLMHEYVNYNAGPDAVVVRRTPGLVMDASQSRGPVTQVSARFKVLGELLQDVAVLAKLGFKVRQGDDNLLHFQTYAPEDRSAYIRLDVYNNTLSSQQVSVTAPTATQVIVAGQGDLVDRTFYQQTNPEALQGETDWGRRIEVFKDQRQTNDAGELQNAGDQTLAERGITSIAAKAVPLDDSTMTFGVDWGLGDLVSIIYNGIEAKAIVSGFVLSADSNGVQLGITLGDTSGLDQTSALLKVLGGSKSRISTLERA